MEKDDEGDWEDVSFITDLRPGQIPQPQLTPAPPESHLPPAPPAPPDSQVPLAPLAPHVPQVPLASHVPLASPAPSAFIPPVAIDALQLDEILLATGVSSEEFALIKSGSRKRALAPYKERYIREALAKGYTLQKIGENIGISASAVNKLRVRPQTY